MRHERALPHILSICVALVAVLAAAGTYLFGLAAEQAAHQQTREELFRTVQAREAIASQAYELANLIARNASAPQARAIVAESLGDEELDEADLISRIDRLHRHRAVLKQGLDLERKKFQDTYDRFDTKTTELTDGFQRVHQQDATQIGSLQSQIENLNVEMEKATATASSNQKVLQHHGERLAGQFVALKKEFEAYKIKYPPPPPDPEDEPGRPAHNPEMPVLRPAGEVLEVDGHNAVINLGAADGVMNGMVFLVVQMEGNHSTGKSLAVVRQVEPGKGVSLVHLYQPMEADVLIDPVARNRPVVQGDRVASPFHALRRDLVFFLDGSFVQVDEFGLQTDLRDLRRRIEEYGGRIAASLTEETDYAVFGNEYDPKNLDQANRLGIKVIPKSGILVFLSTR